MTIWRTAVFRCFYGCAFYPNHLSHLKNKCLVIIEHFLNHLYHPYSFDDRTHENGLRFFKTHWWRHFVHRENQNKCPYWYPHLEWHNRHRHADSFLPLFNVTPPRKRNYHSMVKDFSTNILKFLLTDFVCLAFYSSSFLRFQLLYLLNLTS